MQTLGTEPLVARAIGAVAVVVVVVEKEVIVIE